MGLLDRLRHGWNAFLGKGPPDDINILRPGTIPQYEYIEVGNSSFTRPDRIYSSRGQEKSLISTIYNRIATDVALIDIKHVIVDHEGRYIGDVLSDLNECLTISANKDQTGRQLIQDIVMSMFDEGCVAVVPVDTTRDPEDTESYDIQSLRVGKIIEWFPDFIKVELYNDRTGKKQTIQVDKSIAAIIENPFYAIMNQPNSTLQRLIRKFNLLDAIDAQTGSGKLNLIVQLPYVIKTDARRQQAAARRDDIENQLTKSKYGIVYTDGTEKITQLNRPAENNILNEAQYLTSMLFSQLGLTESILNGTANEETMLNYRKRTLLPILNAITEEMTRKFISKNARTRGQKIKFYSDPFGLVTMKDLAEAVDKFTRNEIMSSNEVRQAIGLKPSDDPKADELRNKNIPEPESGGGPTPQPQPPATGEYDVAEDDQQRLQEAANRISSRLLGT